jgi:hypothetical protein
MSFVSFSSNFVNKIYKIHISLVLFFHSSYLTPLILILLLLMILHKYYLSKCQNEKNYWEMQLC